MNKYHDFFIHQIIQVNLRYLSEHLKDKSRLRIIFYNYFQVWYKSLSISELLNTEVTFLANYVKFFKQSILVSII